LLGLLEDYLVLFCFGIVLSDEAFLLASASIGFEVERLGEDSCLPFAQIEEPILRIPLFKCGVVEGLEREPVAGVLRGSAEVHPILPQLLFDVEVVVLLLLAFHEYFARGHAHLVLLWVLDLGVDLEHLGTLVGVEAFGERVQDRLELLGQLLEFMVVWFYFGRGCIRADNFVFCRAHSSFVKICIRLFFAK